MRFNIRKYKKELKKLLEILFKRIFLIFVLLSLLEIVFCLLIFYQYLILPERKEFEVLETPLAIREELLQEILRASQQKEERFREISGKTYPDLFQPQPELTE